MILIKFVLILLGIYVAFWVIWRLFGKAITRSLLKAFVKRAQRDMDRQSQHYQQYAEGYTPFEESVYVEDDVKVSIRRGSKSDSHKKNDLHDLPIETVDYEDVE